MIKATIIIGKIKAIWTVSTKQQLTHRGFALPLTLFICCLLMVFILCAIQVLHRDQQFDHAYETKIHLITLRENIMTLLKPQLANHTLPASGHYSDTVGDVTYNTTRSSDGLLHITLTMSANGSSETDKMDYDETANKIVNWIEQTEP
ncbi:MAG: competence type IV pilus minor pilin ComGG [Sporolactobacillus sp.]